MLLLQPHNDGDGKSRTDPREYKEKRKGKREKRERAEERKTSSGREKSINMFRESGSERKERGKKDERK